MPINNDWSIWSSLFHLYDEKMDHMGKKPGLIKDHSAPTDQSISSTAHWLGVSEALGGGGVGGEMYAYPGADQTELSYKPDPDYFTSYGWRVAPTDNAYACSAHFELLLLKQHAITVRL